LIEDQRARLEELYEQLHQGTIPGLFERSIGFLTEALKLTNEQRWEIRSLMVTWLRNGYSKSPIVSLGVVAGG